MMVLNGRLNGLQQYYQKIDQRISQQNKIECDSSR